MNYGHDQIRSIELEISTLCNAACPQCPRNVWGGRTIDTLPQANWDLAQLKLALDVPFVQQLEMIYFCGTYGDPMANRYILDMVHWLKATNPTIKIGIHTNGGIGKKDIYRELATCVDFVAFGIDGLADTNHLYRRNVVWDRVMENAAAFVNNGGHAIWDFIVFRHNQHQVPEAREHSRQLGFREFNLKKTGRFFNKSHHMVDHVEVLDLDGQVEYILEPPDEPYVNGAYEVLRQMDLASYVRDTKISCYWQRHHMLYIGADGFVFPCGFLHDRMYGLEAEQTTDHAKIKSMMAAAGGSDRANVFQTRLQDIVDGAWFEQIQASWTGDRLERCSIMCGSGVNLLADQNASIKYKHDLQKQDLT